LDFKTKIILSILFIVGVPLWLKLGDLNNKRFNKSLDKVNPNLAKKSAWFFSKEKDVFSKYIVLIYIILLLLAVWIGFE
jgi:hypothetical protein